MPPKPFLSSSLIDSSEALDASRRHTLFPFPKGSIGGYLRRPDVIIVKDRGIRWPGQAGPDHQGTMHPDNLERLVEVKFPGDILYADQRSAYIDIAGSLQRFSVLEINDCRSDEDKEQDRQLNRQLSPTASSNPLKWKPGSIPSDTADSGPATAPKPVPIYGPTPTARAGHVENWTQQIKKSVDGLLEQGAEGIRALSQEVQQHLTEVTAWLSANGSWIRRESQQAWAWVSEAGGQIVLWTDEQLKVVWEQVRHYTDLSLEMLRDVDWIQILTDLGIAAATVVVVFAVGATLVAAGIPTAVVAGLLVIIRLAQVSWALLASILGGAALGSAVVTG